MRNGSVAACPAISRRPDQTVPHPGCGQPVFLTEHSRSSRPSTKPSTFRDATNHCSSPSASGSPQPSICTAKLATRPRTITYNARPVNIAKCPDSTTQRPKQPKTTRTCRPMDVRPCERAKDLEFEGRATKRQADYSVTNDIIKNTSSGAKDKQATQRGAEQTSNSARRGTTSNAYQRDAGWASFRR